MESALLIRRTNKVKHKKGKILFINAFNEVKDEKTIAYLVDHHIEKIFEAYESYKDIKGFARVVSMEEVLKNDGSLLVTNYVTSTRIVEGNTLTVKNALEIWEDQSKQLKSSLELLFQSLA